MNSPISKRQPLSTALSLLSLAVLVSSCNTNSIPGVQGLNVGVQTEENDPHLYIAFTATTLNLNVGGTLPIFGLQDATVGLSPALPVNGQPGGTVFQFDIDMATLGGVDYALAGLPDGRALPDVDGGQLPRWEFTIGQEPIYLYLSNSVFGIFVPINMDTPGGPFLPDTISMEIDDSEGNLLGEVYAIPTEGGGTSSGLLFLVPFTASPSPASTNPAMN